MATTLPPRTPVAGDRGAPMLAPGRGRQRRWSLALLAVLMTLGSALAFVVLWMNAGNREPVLALANDVPAGQTITDGDLTTVRVSVDGGITPVASSARDQVVGQPAAADLLAGTLLTPEAVGDNEGLGGDEVLVAIPIPVEEFPELETGTRVLLYRASSAGAAAEESSADLIGDGVVFSVQQEEGGSDVRVTVRLSESLAGDTAAALAADEILVMRGGAR
jgi:SAF domain